MIPPSVDVGSDEIDGIGKHCKKLYVSTMYNMLDEDDTPMEDDVWYDIWRLHSNQRTRTFFWLLMHDGLLTVAT